MTDFEQPIDRRQSGALKWDRYKGEDVLPMWVADMDLPAPEAVFQALSRRIAHPILGYTLPPESLVNSVTEHLETHFGWKVDPAWITWIPGVVPGLHIAARLTKKGVLCPVPVYPPFFKVATATNRPHLPLPMMERKGRLVPDMDILRAQAEAADLFLLCNPQNPGGSVLTADELSEIGAVCKAHDLLVVSDEIHADLVLEPGCRHTPLPVAAPEIASRTITLMAPSKTFNIPGLCCAFAIISDPGLRRKFRTAMEGITGHVNLLGYTAAEAAYRQGQVWLKDLKAHLLSNRDHLKAAMDAIPGLRMLVPDATYLAWIDCRETGIPDPAAFFESHGVGLSDGREFGAPGFVRLNFGCSRPTLDAAISRMTCALRDL